MIILYRSIGILWGNGNAGECKPILIKVFIVCEWFEEKTILFMA